MCPPLHTGVIGQHGMISPPATSPQQQFGTVGSLPRLPMAPLDHLTNHMPHHNSSAAVALVKPVPQQASPVGVRGGWEGGGMMECQAKKLEIGLSLRGDGGMVTVKIVFC